MESLLQNARSTRSLADCQVPLQDDLGGQDVFFFFFFWWQEDRGLSIVAFSLPRRSSMESERIKHLRQNNHFTGSKLHSSTTTSDVSSICLRLGSPVSPTVHAETPLCRPCSNELRGGQRKAKRCGRLPRCQTGNYWSSVPTVFLHWQKNRCPPQCHSGMLKFLLPALEKRNKWWYFLKL